MSWPTSSDYREAVQHLDRRAADEELRSGRPSGGPGRPYVWGGGFADVYRVECPSDNTWALKCFTKKVAARHDRYRGIDAKLKEASLPFTVEFKYIERGILIPRLENQWFPVVKMQWVEGQTLDNGQIQRVEGQTLDRFVEDSLEKPRMLRQLLDLWPKLAARLRGAGIAHADLQHGNVLLVPAANGKLALRLVDYDGMWVPQLAGMPSGELGHPAYQHPRRLREGAYNRDVDRFSHLVIDCAVRCLLAGGPKLWQDFHGGDDKLLFAQGDFAEPRQSQLFRTLWQSPDMGARAMLGRLILACGQPLDEAPWLDEVVVNGRVRALTRKEEGQVAEVLAVGKASAATLSPLSPAEGGAAPITQSPPLPLETPVLATIVTRPATATGTVPATPPLHSRLRAAGKSLLRGFAAAANGFDGLLRRLVGEENNILRYFLWAALPLLLLAAGWLAASTFRQTPSAPAATKKSPGAPFVVTVTRPIPAPAPAPVTSPGKEIVIDLGGGVKLEMALIPAGEFLMGSPNSDNNAGGDEKPQHRVRITRPFYLGKHLVTQEQWQAVMGSNPSYFNGPKNAVETVSWDDCQQFLEKLNAKAGHPHPGPLPEGEGEFRLPTEAQWEYACRAGSTTRYCFGDDDSELGEYAWYAANSGDKTHPVGEKKPNAWGLYDMHGNVWEWCQDWYDSGYYAKSPTDDPTGAATGSYRVLRGGGWDRPAGHCRSAYRSDREPGRRNDDLGFRASRVAGDTGAGIVAARPSVALKLRPIEAKAVEAGKPLQVKLSLENADAWAGKVRYQLVGQAPSGATIDPQSGDFSWTPPSDQPAGQEEISLSATDRQGQTTQTSFIVTVTRPIPAPAPVPVTPPGKEIVIDLGGGVNLEMILIPAGEFLMGSPDSQNNAGVGAKPQHRVRITRPFYLGKHLVTQEQWQAVTGNNPSHFKGPKNPVETVSWDDC